MSEGSGYFFNRLADPNSDVLVGSEFEFKKILNPETQISPRWISHSKYVSTRMIIQIH